MRMSARSGVLSDRSSDHSVFHHALAQDAEQLREQPLQTALVPDVPFLDCAARISCCNQEMAVASGIRAQLAPSTDRGREEAVQSVVRLPRAASLVVGDGACPHPKPLGELTACPLHRLLYTGLPPKVLAFVSKIGLPQGWG